MIVKAENITVEHLKDKDTNKVSGGGIEVTGTGVPNLSVVTGGQDKRQDTNATAVNTEFEIAGESKTAEELGFNTDLEKAQVITKDEDKVLDSELHTDLLNQSERDKIAEAGEKIGDLAGALANSNDGGIFNTYKENRYGNLFNKYAASQKEYLAMLGDPNLSDIDKRNVVNELITSFLKDRKYEGKMPVVIIGSKTEAVDSRYDGNERIFITKEDLNSPDVLSKLGHELGHFNTYDKDEKTAGNIEKKIDVVINTSETNGEYNSQLEKLKEKYKDLPNEEKALELQNKIPDEYKENFVGTATIVIGGVILIGSYYSGQKTKEYLESEEGKRAWSKFEENLKEEWEDKKNKGIAYTEFYQASLEAFLTNKAGIKDIAIKNETIHKIQVDVGDVIITPDIDESKFKEGKNEGTSGYLNKKDGSWWEKDTAKHGGSTWKRWPKKPDNKKKKNDQERRSIGKDGKVLRR